MMILSPNKTNFQQAVELLHNGEVVAVPTETVYGLAADARIDEALTKIYQAKNRPNTNPLIIHLPNRLKGLKRLESEGWANLESIPENLLEQLELLAQNFWPGPLSLILPKGQRPSAIASAGLATLAFRVPEHIVFQELLNLFGSPLAAPSANKANSISPTTALDVKAELNNEVQLCLDGGSSQVGVESTIVGVSLDLKGLQIFRYGGLSQQVLESFLQTKLQPPPINKTLAPGMMKKHYAPQKSLSLLDSKITESQVQELLLRSDVGLLIFKQAQSNAIDFQSSPEKAKVYTIYDAEEGQFSCSHLYETLRKLDSHKSLSKLYVWPQNISNTHLWPTLLDRLTRASS